MRTFLDSGKVIRFRRGGAIRWLYTGLARAARRLTLVR
jgi:hypothetical protein